MLETPQNPEAVDDGVMEHLNPFTIAQAQLDEAAEILQLEPEMHAFLRQPMREFHFTIPVRMDNGRSRVFEVVNGRRRTNTRVLPAAGGCNNRVLAMANIRRRGDAPAR